MVAKGELILFLLDFGRPVAAPGDQYFQLTDRLDWESFNKSVFAILSAGLAARTVQSSARPKEAILHDREAFVYFD